MTRWRELSLKLSPGLEPSSSAACLRMIAQGKQSNRAELFHPISEIFLVPDAIAFAVTHPSRHGIAVWPSPVVYCLAPVRASLLIRGCMIVRGRANFAWFVHLNRRRIGVAELIVVPLNSGNALYKSADC